MTRPRADLATVVLDCADAHEMARFWCGLLGWDLEAALTEPDWVLVRNPSGGAGLAFQAEQDYVAPVWPEQEGRQQKMLHLDLRVDDLDAAAAQAVSLGAIVPEHQPQDRVRVLLDPAGHPFCVFLD